MIRSDNVTVVACLNRQGGTRSPALHTLTAEIPRWRDPASPPYMLATFLE